MNISIHTDSQKVFNTFLCLIERQKNNTENWKYIYFLCKDDFIESLYVTTLYVSWNNTTITPTKTPDDYLYIWITTGDIQRAKKYNNIVEVEDKYFTYK